MELNQWPRIKLTLPPCPPGLSIEETEQAFLAICQPLWSEEKIPVIAWGSEIDGLQLWPPQVQ